MCKIAFVRFLQFSLFHLHLSMYYIHVSFIIFIQIWKKAFVVTYTDYPCVITYAYMPILPRSAQKINPCLLNRDHDDKVLTTSPPRACALVTSSQVPNTHFRSFCVLHLVDLCLFLLLTSLLVSAPLLLPLLLPVELPWSLRVVLGARGGCQMRL